MKAAYELVMILLRFWLFGIGLITAYAISDFIFRDGAWKKWLVVERIGLALFWPVALCSRAGRATLFSKLKERR